MEQRDGNGQIVHTKTHMYATTLEACSYHTATQKVSSAPPAAEAQLHNMARSTSNSEKRAGTKTNIEELEETLMYTRQYSCCLVTLCAITMFPICRDALVDRRLPINMYGSTRSTYLFQIHEAQNNYNDVSESENRLNL